MHPHVSYVKDPPLCFENAQADIALLLCTLECITKSNHAYITTGQELVSQITGAYTDDENNIHVERLGVEAVYV